MFDSHAHKFTLSDDPPRFSPSLQQAQVEHEGSTYALTLVRSLFTDEGTALLERLPGGAGYFVQNGEWRVQSHDEGPSALFVDFDDSGDIENHAHLLDKLCAALTSRADSWADGYQPMGGF